MNIALSICIKRNMVSVTKQIRISGGACSSRAENGNHDRFRRKRKL